MPTQAPSTPVDICNLALGRLGETPIASIEDPESPKAEVMARWYDQVRRETLREYVWNFCQGYRVLTRAGTGNANYDDKYDLPVDCVRVNAVGDDRLNPITDFDIFERELHCSNGTSVPVWFNKDITTVSKMDPLFIKVFSIRLAMASAFELTKKKSMVESMSDMLRLEEPKATSVDGQEKPPIRIQKSKYLTARRSGGSLGRDNRYYEYE